jgi:FkbM family methyltransferase
VSLRVDLGEIAGNDLFCLDAHYESVTLRLWRRLARDAATVVDLGSHVGLYALAAAAENPRARVLAVEPFPRNVALLQHNAASFPNVSVLPFAVGATSGDGVLEERPLSGGGVLLDESVAAAASSSAGSQRHMVPVVTLLDLGQQAGIDRIDLLKMDLEGAEHELLTGQDAFWAQLRPRHVIVEIGYGAGDAHRLRAILRAMVERGYSARRCQSLRVLGWLRRGDLANWHFRLDGERQNLAAPVRRALARRASGGCPTQRVTASVGTDGRHLGPLAHDLGAVVIGPGDRQGDAG